MTCSPNQSLFTNAAQIGDQDSRKPYVAALDYAVSMDYAQGLYDSCKDVSNPTTGAKALDLLCGNWESGCNATNWLRFLTDKNINSMVPFQINVFTETNEDLPELMSDTIVSCNETAPGNFSKNFYHHFFVQKKIFKYQKKKR